MKKNWKVKVRKKLYYDFKAEIWHGKIKLNLLKNDVTDEWIVLGKKFEKELSEYLEGISNVLYRYELEICLRNQEKQVVKEKMTEIENGVINIIKKFVERFEKIKAEEIDEEYFILL